jgi:hypothetical protein
MQKIKLLKLHSPAEEQNWPVEHGDNTSVQICQSLKNKFGLGIQVQRGQNKIHHNAI